jgi:hypothetical protein
VILRLQYFVLVFFFLVLSLSSCPSPREGGGKGVTLWGGGGAGSSKRESGEWDVRRGTCKKQRIEKNWVQKKREKKIGYEKLGTIKGMTR